MRYINFPVARAVLLGVPAALALIGVGPQPAHAILTYNIYESGANIVIETSGALNLGANASTLNCGTEDEGGAIVLGTDLNGLCTGPGVLLTTYNITGPLSFGGAAWITPASSVAGLSTILLASMQTGQLFAINPSYVFGTPIVSSATFNGQTLAGLGLSTSGLVGTWTLDDGVGDTIRVVVGAPTPETASVPGPLPLFGAGAAFAWSRRLRRRVALNAGSSTPQI